MSLVTAIQCLQNQGVPTSSFVSATRYILRDDMNEERSDLGQDEYQIRIKNLIDTPMILEDQKHAKYAYLYIIQELVKSHNGISNLSELTEIVEEALDCSKKFIEENKYFWESQENKDDGVVRVRDDGTIKPKKGELKRKAKIVFAEHYVEHPRKSVEGRELRKTIIQLFIEEVGLTVAGAPTYYANCKNEWNEVN